MTGHSPLPRDVVFLHGLGGGGEDWAEVAGRMGPAFRCFTPDLPGFGRAPKPEEGYDPASLARWLQRELTRLRIDRPALVGHSLGGRIAGELAAIHPLAIPALALVAPLGAAGYGVADVLRWKAMSRQTVLRSVSEGSLRKALGYGFEVDGPGKRGFVERGLAGRTGPEGAAITRAMERSVDGILGAAPLRKRLLGTPMPLLLVVGTEDPLAPPEEIESLLETRPDARLVRLGETGHYPMLERPERLRKVLTDFLKERRAASG